jgi:hypothetical protein
MNKIIKGMNNKKIEIAERRRRVASMLNRSMTEVEIAQAIGGNISQPTISRDIAAIRQMAQQFVYDLAKSNLAFYYKQCIDGIDEVKRNANHLLAMASNPRDNLLSLKIIIECEQAKFSMIKEGPAVLALKALEEKVEKVTTTIESQSSSCSS